MDLVSRSAKESSFYPFYFLSEKDNFSAILNKALFAYQGETTVRLGGARHTEVVFSSPTRPATCRPPRNSFSTPRVT